MNEELLSKQLDEINRNLLKLIAVVGVSGKENDEKLRALAKAGFSSREIEQLVGVPSGTVRRKLSEWKRKRG